MNNNKYKSSKDFISNFYFNLTEKMRYPLIFFDFLFILFSLTLKRNTIFIDFE